MSVSISLPLQADPRHKAAIIFAGHSLWFGGLILKSEIKLGVEYAFREHRESGTPFQRVRIIQHTRGRKWRAQWIDPDLMEFLYHGW
jgi:hypothetical protein